MELGCKGLVWRGSDDLFVSEASWSERLKLLLGNRSQ